MVNYCILFLTAAMRAWIKTHPLIKILFPNYVWSIANTGKKVFLTFDDGPIPEITEWVLNELNKHNVKATFFCIGDNIGKHPEIFKTITASGHQVGNHTFNHLNGWKTPKESYTKNVEKCTDEILRMGVGKPNLFRPPYGKIKPSQSLLLRKSGYKIIMWDVLSADFDQKTTPEQCLDNVLSNVTSGSIIVFHDSLKAFPNLQYALPKTLEFLSENGYQCEVLN